LLISSPLLPLYSLFRRGKAGDAYKSALFVILMTLVSAMMR